jgi:hypothetical protein
VSPETRNWLMLWKLKGCSPLLTEHQMRTLTQEAFDSQTNNLFCEVRVRHHRRSRTVDEAGRNVYHDDPYITAEKVIVARYNEPVPEPPQKRWYEVIFRGERKRFDGFFAWKGVKEEIERIFAQEAA